LSIPFEKIYINILALEMASPGNRLCANSTNCIGTLSFPAAVAWPACNAAAAAAAAAAGGGAAVAAVHGQDVTRSDAFNCGGGGGGGGGSSPRRKACIN